MKDRKNRDKKKHVDLEEPLPDLGELLPVAKDTSLKRNEEKSPDSAAFLSEIAHDLRNFLEGMDQMVLSRPEISAAPEVRDIVYREILTLVLRTECHSDELRASASSRPIRCERVELGPLCEATTRSLAPFLRKRKVSVDVPDSAAVIVERASLSRALATACYTVCRSTADTAALRIVCSRDGDGDSVSLVIEGDSCLEDANEGLRLEELDAYDRVLRRQDGRLFHERVGPVLRVTLSIPQNVASESEREIENRARSVTATSETASRVLIVDDNEDAARSLAALLEIDGFETEVRLDGRSALEAARTQPPDVISLDLGLPDVDGFEVCAKLREVDSTRGVRVVAVSGLGDEKARRRMEEAGFDDHLLKPVDPSDLRRILETPGWYRS